MVIKQHIRLILILFVFSALSCAYHQKGDIVLVKGRVSCEGKGLEGVAVTDGASVVVTGRSGRYQLAVKPGNRFVYISSPAGYTVPVRNSVPQFYHDLGPSGAHPRSNARKAGMPGSQPEGNIPGNQNNYSGKKKLVVDFVLEKLPVDDTRHGFVVWADPQVKTEKEVLQAKEVADDLTRLLKNYQDIPFHGLGCGDIIGDNPELFSQIKDILTPSGIPFYQSMGNHDMHYNGRSNYLASEPFNNHFGPDYYSFNRGEIHYVVLNNVFYIGRDYFYIGYLTEEQLAWLENDLSLVEEGSVVVVSLHIPTALNQQDIRQFSYSSIAQSMTNKNALYEILSPYQVHIISGHTHVTNNVEISPNIFEHNVSAVCGAWWQGDYSEDGTPKGYAVFEVNGREMTWYYKSSGLERDHQFRAYKTGENPEQPGYITVNIWNWDPGWKAFWYEDGVQAGELEAYSGTDPETAMAYADKEKLDYKWITARTTNHMFRAKPKSATAEITIEVTDRFGHSYKATL